SFAVKTYLPKLPILANDQREVIPLFQDVKVTWTAPTELGDALSVFDIAENPAASQTSKPYRTYRRDYSFKGIYDRDGVGKKDVDVKFTAIVYLNDTVSEEAMAMNWQRAQKMTTDYISSLVAERPKRTIHNPHDTFV